MRIELNLKQILKDLYNNNFRKKEIDQIEFVILMNQKELNEEVIKCRYCHRPIGRFIIPEPRNELDRCQEYKIIAYCHYHLEEKDRI